MTAGKEQPLPFQVALPVEGGECPRARTRQSSSYCPGSPLSELQPLPISAFDPIQAHQCHSLCRSPRGEHQPHSQQHPSTAHLPPTAGGGPQCRLQSHLHQGILAVPLTGGGGEPPTTHRRMEQPGHRRRGAGQLQLQPATTPGDLA